jgi:hypothetical protein
MQAISLSNYQEFVEREALPIDCPPPMDPKLDVSTEGNDVQEALLCGRRSSRLQDISKSNVCPDKCGTEQAQDFKQSGRSNVSEYNVLNPKARY